MLGDKATIDRKVRAIRMAFMRLWKSMAWILEWTCSAAACAICRGGWSEEEDEKGDTHGNLQEATARMMRGIIYTSGVLHSSLVKLFPHRKLYPLSVCCPSALRKSDARRMWWLHASTCLPLGCGLNASCIASRGYSMLLDVAAHRPRIAIHLPEQHVEHILHSFLVDMDHLALASHKALTL